MFTSDMSSRNRWLIFCSCFMAIAATASVFVIRGMVSSQWAAEFNLTDTQQAELLGVGLWPFAVTIVLFSLVVDKFGYGKVMLFAFLCHVISTLVLLLAHGYWGLYLGTLIVSLGNGAAQAVADPVVASMFKQNKTKWLNVLHASWPAGLVGGGLLVIGLSRFESLDWRWPIGALLIPFAAYGVMMIGRKFPVHERVEAGVSYREMLRETGGLGMMLVLGLMFAELARVFGVNSMLALGVAAAISLVFGVYARSLGHPMFLFILLIMLPLATTELGTDSWITSLMDRLIPMDADGTHAFHPGWVLVYTSLIMMVLRFCAGPVVKIFSPVGLMMVSSGLAMCGLLALSRATGLGILFAATLYGVGKTYLWPTVLGIVAERFPKGGALSLNATSAVGMMGVGVIGAVFMGRVLDRQLEQRLAVEQPAIHAQVVDVSQSVIGSYRAVIPDKLKALPEADQKAVEALKPVANQEALAVTATLPLVMLLCFAGLWIHFKRQGGYTAVHLTSEPVTDQELNEPSTPL